MIRSVFWWDPPAPRSAQSFHLILTEGFSMSMRWSLMIGAATLLMAACGDSDGTTTGGGGAGSGGGSTSDTTTGDAGGTTTGDGGAGTTTGTTDTTSGGGAEAYDCAHAEAIVQDHGMDLDCSDTAGGVKQMHDGCTALEANFPACGDEFNALIDCVEMVPNREWMCDGMNRPEPPQGSCQTEQDALGACAKS
jgi:hypothetical protein